MHTKVCIVCPIHGEFWQFPCDHLIQKSGCHKCKGETIRQRVARSTTWFQDRAIKVHGDKYDYSKVEYKNALTKVCIVCPIHGEFWQVPNYHLCGNGCPKCNQSHLEEKVEIVLNNSNIEYVPQKTFDWLTFKSSLSLDFYLPQYNIAIECQGGQHFVDVERFGGEASFIKTKQRDERKRELCKANGVELVYFLEDKYEEYVKELDNNYFIDIESLIGYIMDKESSSVEDLLLEAQ